MSYLGDFITAVLKLTAYIALDVDWQLKWNIGSFRDFAVLADITGRYPFLKWAFTE